jgi:hypothetical protein
MEVLIPMVLAGKPIPILLPETMLAFGVLGPVTIIDSTQHIRFSTDI